MRKITGAVHLLILVAFATVVHADNGGIELVTPYLEARLSSNDNMYVYEPDGTPIGLSEGAKLTEKLFYDLLRDRSPAGDEAIAYLLFIYVGEHTGGELVCETVNRGQRMVPIIEQYMESLPASGLEPDIQEIQTDNPTSKARWALVKIEAGKSCHH
jgi:hypothetical protein